MAHLIDEPADANPGTLDWQKLLYKNTILAADVIIGGIPDILTDTVTTTLIPNSIIAVNHSAYIFDGSETITGFGQVEISYTVKAIIYARAAGDAIDLFFSNEQPTFQPEKGGWYHPALNARACWWGYKAGTNLFTNKTYFYNDASELAKVASMGYRGIDTSLIITGTDETGPYIMIKKGAIIDVSDVIIRTEEDIIVKRTPFTTPTFITVTQQGVFGTTNNPGYLYLRRNGKYINTTTRVLNTWANSLVNSIPNFNIVYSSKINKNIIYSSESFNVMGMTSYLVLHSAGVTAQNS